MALKRQRLGHAARDMRGRRAVRFFATWRRVWSDPAGRFLIRYPLATALLFLVPPLMPSSEPWMIRATIWSLALTRFVIPATVRVSEPSLSIGITTIDIVPDCTPLFPTLLLLGGIIAFPAPWRWKLVGALAGVILLWCYNVARILALMAVLRFMPRYFDVIHVYLWQSVTMLVVVGCFMLWLRVVGDRVRLP